MRGGLMLAAAALAAIGCRRAEPLHSCRDSLAGIWRVEQDGDRPGDPAARRWALLDRGTRLEGYPLFDDTGAEPAAPRHATPSSSDVVLSPRSLDLIRSHTSLLGHVERWVMRGGQKCQVRASARIYDCRGDGGGDSIEVQLKALSIPTDLAVCAAALPAGSSPARPQRWRRER